MRWRNDDFISILAITSSAALSVGMTAAFLSRTSVDPAMIDVEVPALAVQQVPLDHVLRFRPVTITVDATGPVAALRPGARVDVHASYPSEPDRTLFSQRLGSNLVVLANEAIVSDAMERAVLTLRVPLQDADRLATATSRAQIRVLVRSSRDPIVPRKLR